MNIVVLLFQSAPVEPMMQIYALLYQRPVHPIHTLVVQAMLIDRALDHIFINILGS